MFCKFAIIGGKSADNKYVKRDFECMEKKTPTDLSIYEKNYSETGFWKKAKSLGKSVLKPAMLLYYLMKSADVPLYIKSAIAGALGYLILPSDLLPDFIPFVGFADDSAAMMTILKVCHDYITPEIKAQAESKLNELLR